MINGLKVGNTFTDDKKTIVQELNNYFSGVADELRRLLPEVSFDISKFVSYTDNLIRRTLGCVLLFRPYNISASGEYSRSTQSK